MLSATDACTPSSPQTYYYGESPMLSDAEFENLKEDLVWSGSKVAVLQPDEQRFLEAQLAVGCGRGGGARGKARFAQPWLPLVPASWLPLLAPLLAPLQGSTAHAAPLPPPPPLPTHPPPHQFNKGSPIMSDADFDALKARLKAEGSVVAVQGPRCSLRSRKVVSDASVDYLKLVGGWVGG